MQRFQYIAEPEIGPVNIDQKWFDQGEIFVIFCLEDLQVVVLLFCTC